MTIVTKTINGIQYLYYQDSVPGAAKVVTTYIGRSDSTGPELTEARVKAFNKHFVELLKVQGRLASLPYHFEHQPSSPYLTDDLLELVKSASKEMRGNLRAEELEEIDKTMFIKYVHGTTAIEGNTLTEEETARLLEHDLTSSNKTLNETLEVANYREVKEFVQYYRGDLSESFILRTHKLLMKGLRSRDNKPIEAGEYRTRKASIVGADYAPSAPELIPQRMDYIMKEYTDGIARNIHPVELATIFHLKFEQVHPFRDGNGRTGREILNFMLDRNGFPRIYITPRHRSDYLSSLQAGDKGDSVPLIDFVVNRICATFAYLQSRTSLSPMMGSEIAKQALSQEAGPELAELYVALLQKLKESEELP